MIHIIEFDPYPYYGIIFYFLFHGFSWGPIVRSLSAGKELDTLPLFQHLNIWYNPRTKTVRRIRNGEKIVPIFLNCSIWIFYIICALKWQRKKLSLYLLTFFILVPMQYGYTILLSHLVARGIPRYFEPRPELKSDINHRPEPECWKKNWCKRLRWGMVEQVHCGENRCQHPLGNLSSQLLCGYFWLSCEISFFSAW